MAVLHLQFDIDSEVHPELYEMLASIGSSRLQAERLRQLAATGLVWERLRLQAYGRMEVPDLGRRPATSADASASFAVKATAPAAQAVPQGDAPAVAGTDQGDFVDLSDAVVLAHLADPEPEPVDVPTAEHDVGKQHEVVDVEAAEISDPIASAPPLPPARDTSPPLPLPLPPALALPLHEIRSAVLALPVLTDVVAAAELPNMQAVAAANEATPAAAHSGGGPAVPAGAQIHELVAVQKTATRSRLMRMKEKGLFKNE
ncbi:MAG TPA: hypothetical protein VEZ89_15735 [Rubrivivax sp.]|nr:hypothetical protein [Rubrivivax sp.]